jgi:hypothetical protein
VEEIDGIAREVKNIKAQPLRRAENMASTCKTAPDLTWTRYTCRTRLPFHGGFHAALCDQWSRTFFFQA